MVGKTLILFAISFTLISLNEKSNYEDENKILWSATKQLTWDDFEGIADTTDVFTGAMTYSEIKIDKSHLENKIPTLKVGCYFIKNRSWKIVTDDYSLGHEQLHFDITELFARKIRKSLDSLNKKKIEKTEQYQKVIDCYMKNLESYQDLYDNEVYFNEKKQAYWRKKIALDLVKYKKWEYIKN